MQPFGTYQMVGGDHNAPAAVMPSALLLPLPVAVLISSFCLPAEVSLMAGPLRLSPFRLILLMQFVPCLLALLQDTKRLSLIDLLMITHGLWAVLALCVSMGPATAVETGGIYTVETVGAYLVARRYITSLEAFEALARFMFTVTAILCVFAMLESLSGQHLLRDIFKMAFGGPGAHTMDQRMGLTRAFTSFEHPILFGVFCASSFAMSYFVLSREQIALKTAMRLGAVALATFFSLSGGPFVGLAFQMGLIGWDRITAGIRHRWSMLLGIFALLWLALSMASNRSPVLVFVSYLTFSTASAYNRVHIWTYGTAEVARNPFFGIGLNDWIRAPWMSDSMDTFWLLTTVRYGLPALVVMLVAICLIIRSLSKKKHNSPRYKQAAKAWVITFAGLALAGLTVHFWNALMVQFFFLIGCGASLATMMPSCTQAAPPARHIHPPQPLKEIRPWI